MSADRAPAAPAPARDAATADLVDAATADLVDAATTDLVDAALREDIGDGDRSTLWSVPADATGAASIRAKASGVLAGLDIAAAVFRRLDPALRVESLARAGDVLAPGSVVLRVAGPLRSILTGERTALNFLQRLSGIATLTRRYVDGVAGTGARILDTRKTTPGWRLLEKAAVRAGGGHNHRFGLFDAVLLKENHIAAAGGIAAALERVRAAGSDLPVEVEVRSLDELDAAIAAGARHLLLDNMDPPTLREAVRRARARTGLRLEASGNVTLETVRAIAGTGVDAISVGALTHSAPALDLSMLLD